MTHISRDALARYMINTESYEDRITVGWHLGNCAICKEEITVRDIIEIAREARLRLAVAARAADRN